MSRSFYNAQTTRAMNLAYRLTISTTRADITRLAHHSRDYLYPRRANPIDIIDKAEYFVPRFLEASEAREG